VRVECKKVRDNEGGKIWMECGSRAVEVEVEVEIPDQGHQGCSKEKKEWRYVKLIEERVTRRKKLTLNRSQAIFGRELS
jgi:hypothetical protein